MSPSTCIRSTCRQCGLGFRRPSLTCRLKIANRSFYYYAPVLWNNLPSDLRHVVHHVILSPILNSPVSDLSTSLFVRNLFYLFILYYYFLKFYFNFIYFSVDE